MGRTACTEPQFLYKGALYLTSVRVQGCTLPYLSACTRVHFTLPQSLYKGALYLTSVPVQRSTLYSRSNFFNFWYFMFIHILLFKTSNFNRKIVWSLIVACFWHISTFSCVLVLTTLKMGTWEAETCRRYYIIKIHSYIQVYLLVHYNKLCATLMNLLLP